jgi:hypothetical protein
MALSEPSSTMYGPLSLNALEGMMWLVMGACNPGLSLFKMVCPILSTQLVGHASN